MFVVFAVWAAFGFAFPMEPGLLLALTIWSEAESPVPWQGVGSTSEAVP
jgi:hypothetical protein